MKYTNHIKQVSLFLITVLHYVLLGCLCLDRLCDFIEKYWKPTQMLAVRRIVSDCLVYIASITRIFYPMKYGVYRCRSWGNLPLVCLFLGNAMQQMTDFNCESHSENNNSLTIYKYTWKIAY